MNFKKVVICVVSLLLISAQTIGATVAEVKQSIIRQANAMGVEPAIMLSIAKAESGFRQEARGGGAVGVFQLMPATAKRLGVNPYNMEENIKGGIQYYKNMYKAFGSMELAIAAYNVGPDRIRRSNNTVPTCAQSFVARIMKDYKYNLLISVL